MARVACQLYALMGLSPTYDDLCGCTLLSCLPVDIDENGNIAEDTRYCVLLLVPVGTSIVEVMRAYEDMRPYSYQWLTYCWEV